MPPTGWELDYNPWWLFLRAAALVGVETWALSTTYWRVSEWNVHHSPITVQCNHAIHGWISYPCEGTLAFARCFPLLAISVSLLVAARFMLQSRMYYQLLKKKAILDFDNYQFWRDPAMLLLASFLVIGMQHYVLDLVIPPYLHFSHNTALAKATNVWQFVSPCLIFFVVFERGCNIERHLVTINKLFEDDPTWAMRHLNGSQLYSESQLHSSASEVLGRLHEIDGDDHFNLDGFLDEILKGATPSKGTLHEEKKPESALMGMWPGPILLAKHLHDNDSRAFKRSMQAFMLIFVIVHMLLFTILTSFTLHEIFDSIPGQRPLGSYLPAPFGIAIEEINNTLYQSLGTGDCLDEGMMRPDCYWKALQDMKVESAVGGDQMFSSSQVTEEPFSHSLVSLRFKVSRTNATQPERFTDDRDLQPLRESDDASILSTLATSIGHRLSGACYGWLIGWYVASGGSAQPSGIATTRRNACGQYCSSEACIGFSIDEDRCTIYNYQHTKEPLGWKKCASTSNYTGFQIVQTGSLETATCWKKLTLKGQSEELVGAFVGVLHIGLVAFFYFWTMRHLKPLNMIWLDWVEPLMYKK